MDIDAPMKDVAEVPKDFDNGAIKVQQPRQRNLTKKQREDQRLLKRAEKKYGRGKGPANDNTKNKKLRGGMRAYERKTRDATLKAKEIEILHEHTTGFLEPEHEMEKTAGIRQEEIQEHVSISTAQKRFELKLDQLGPYLCEYTRNGRELLLAGRKGHVATMDWRAGKLGCEIQLNETVKDIKWLHNNQFFAVAQRNNVYIYDRDGVEIHRLKKHQFVTHMEFLPYHFLLATVGSHGFLKYQDTSTGLPVGEHQTRLGEASSMAQNPYNAVIHLGHRNGAVTLWSPNVPTPLVKLLAHHGPIRSMAIDREGRYMVTGGQDQKMAIWDIRMFKEVQSYKSHKPLSDIVISDTGLVATAWGTKSTIWKDLFQKDLPEQTHVTAPYMQWGGEGRTFSRVRWCPYEDVLGYGHDQGFSSIIVPGAGEANFDALEVNPFETKKERRETEVRGLLNKLQPDMIALDPHFVGKLDVRSHEKQKAAKDLDKEEGAGSGDEKIEEKMRNKMRGKNTAAKRYMRKQQKRNVIDEKRLKVEATWEKIQTEEEGKKKKNQSELGPALSRFA